MNATPQQQPEPPPDAGSAPPPRPAPQGAAGGCAAPPRPTAVDGLRFALGTLTVLPVRPRRWDRPAARRGMACAPVAGLAVGAAGALAGGLLLVLGASPLLAAVATVAVPAAGTRALHLDGLADVADGLGSGKPGPAALRIMKQSDIGPFGVLTLVLVLLAQVAAVNELYGEGGWGRGALDVVVAAVTARTALTVAARAGVPAARADGLGAAVAGAVPPRTLGWVLAAVGVPVTAAGALIAGPDLARGWPYWQGAVLGGVRYACAAGLGLGAAELLLRHCCRRLGGVTGDVFGALAEAAATATLVLLALG